MCWIDDYLWYVLHEGMHQHTSEVTVVQFMGGSIQILHDDLVDSLFATIKLWWWPTDALHPFRQSAFVGFHQFQRPTWMAFWGDIQWTPSGKQCHSLCRISPTLATYHHEMASIPLVEVSRESYSVSSKGEPLMGCTPLSKIVKPVWAKKLTRLCCLMVYIKFQFAYATTR